MFLDTDMILFADIRAAWDEYNKFSPDNMLAWLWSPIKIQTVFVPASCYGILKRVEALNGRKIWHQLPSRDFR